MTATEFARFIDAFGTGEEIVLRRVDDGLFRLEEGFEYADSEFGVIRIPAGLTTFTTELASIPDQLTWLVPKLGRHTPAAILHDALVDGGTESTYRTWNEATIPRTQADRIFLDALRASGVNPARARMIWSASTLATILSIQPIRTIVGALIVLAMTITHALEVLGVTSWLPWMLDGTGPGRTPANWAISIVVIAVALFVLGRLLLSAGETAALAVQAAVAGLVYLPVLVMMPPLLIWRLVERISS